MALTSLTIGSSAGATQVAVPNVVGQPQAAAEQALKNRGLKAVISLIEADGTEGTVFSQNPAANTAVNRGSTVRLAIIENPDIPVDIGQQLIEIKAALALVETNEDAEARKAEVLAQIALVETESKADERNLAVQDKLDTALDKLDTLETEASADVRNQAVLDKLDTLETDEDAEQRKQEILDKIDEHDNGKGEAAPARKSSSTRRS